MKKKNFTNEELQTIHGLHQQLINSLRIVIYVTGALKYAAFEQLQTLSFELKKIDPSLKTPQLFDLTKDIDKIIDNSESILTRVKHRFIAQKDHEEFEDRAYATYQCNAALSLLSNSEIFQEAMRIGKAKKNYSLLSNQIDFLKSVREKSRKSNFDADKLIQERIEVLESINAKPFLIKKDDNVEVYDLAPEREEVENGII